MIVNPVVWYAERELDFVPRHFIKCPTNVTPDSKHYIENKTSGRYAYATSIENYTFVYFEDERDATVYELIWAGSEK
jgi:hypothetical protein